ncbi:F-box only protein 10 isoform X3 [Marmota marmota marmota]|uniref:F-box only protein 10 isoform X3 n=1 Tax=Marmota marmota marmota TaxID=9994 RepID=UPI0020928E6C|nr:F-box only protein 10 isoform X3 [Marmota marmota marmota]
MEAGGLPLELWRMILAYLHLPDLGRCSLVCRAWYELILSLDSTRWRQLCLGCTECRHPNWPNQPDVEPESWREAFKQHYLASKTWTKNALDLESSVCFSLFRRRRERRTLSVGPGHEFDSLGSALAMASLYDRIVLFPGVYEEQGEIILKVPVEIVGHGKLGEVALLASIDQHCSTTRLCNLIFMPAWFSPIMYKIVMLRNDIYRCRASGIFLRLEGGGLIAGNNIYHNAEAGVDIRKKSNPLILCNQIHHGLRSGIVVLGNGKGVIRNNQIFSNKEAGIYILYHGNPVVSGNHIFKGRAAGIAVNENGKGLITGSIFPKARIKSAGCVDGGSAQKNVIRENQWGGVDIRRGGIPVLRSNLICFGYSDGVVVGDEGKGLIEGNTIYANKGCGVWMMSSSLPHVTSNHVSYNGLYGVAVFSQKDGSSEFPGGHGAQENFSEDGDAILWETELEKEDDPLRRPLTIALVESNSINHNGASGLYVQSSEALQVITNVIHANGDRGITVAQSGQLTRVANNSISCNRQSGVKVEAQCKVELRGNGIYDNRGHGIITKGDSTVVVENDIIGNRGSGLQLLPRSDTKVLKNRIHSFRAYGIAVRGRAKALVQENIIFQGKSNKTIFQQISNNRECIMQNNKFLVLKKKSDTWRLVNPPARPHLENSLRGPSAAHSGQKVTAMATRITARVEGGYHSNRSIFCTIL